MTIPFLDFFKKKTAKQPPAPAAAPRPAVEKPSSERLSKTVMPNATRAPLPHDPFREAARAGSSSAFGTAPTPAGRTISFGGSAPNGRSADLPPAVALALEPNVERAISLELADVVRHMPQGFVRPLENEDASRRVLLKASELERGMASGKPTVSLATIYQQVPEIFITKVAPGDAAQVELPFQKVLEQFSSLQVRVDQARDQAVPQVETPFLQVTLEDNERFGTTTEALQTGPMPPVRLQPATAESIAAAEPEPAASERFITAPPPPVRQISMRAPVAPEPKTNGANHAPAPEKPAQSAPARIPFQLSPKGTDVPATERVPASSGPSVPTSLAGSSAPTRIPFKLSAPSANATGEPWLTKENFENSDALPTEAAAPVVLKAKDAGVKIALALKPILESLPPFQLTGDLRAVADDAMLEVPFFLVEPQLASGRVLLKPDEFAVALPEEHRALFNAKEAAASIPLPLHEVLKNLPSASLRMRDDQVEQEKGENFATPFSAKAEEDAKRFKVAGTPVEKPKLEVLPPPVVEPVAVATPELTVVETPAASPPEIKIAERTPLQIALDTDDEVDAKAVVAHAGRMAGVKACAVMFSDGLSLAGNLPEEYEAEGLCAMAPSLLQRIENHMVETKLGPLGSMTLSCEKAAVTFFMHENLCLAALHSKDELAPDVREQLTRAVHELSKKYSHPV